MERRMFLSALKDASLNLLLTGPLTELARAQYPMEPGAISADQSPFETSHIEVAGNTVIRTSLWARPSCSVGARLSTDERNVAIPCAEACRGPYGNMRRFTRLRT